MRLQLVTDRDEFAAQREPLLRRLATSLEGSVRRALRRLERGEDDPWGPLMRRMDMLIRQRFHAETGRFTTAELRERIADFNAVFADTMGLTTPPAHRENLDVQAARIAASLATAALGLALEAAATHGQDESETRLGKVWISMEDELVRPTHARANGQKVGLGETFHVGSSQMSRPGDMRAPVEEWINCRCILGIEPLAASLAADGMNRKDEVMAAQIDETMQELPELAEADRLTLTEDIPWHGVLAPEGVMSGDGRKFADGSLRTRDLPLPLAWQKVTDSGHDGAIVVGRIDEVWRKDGQMRGRGVMLSTVPEMDEVVGLMVAGGIRGVSIDADDGTMQMELKDGTPLEEAMAALRPETDDYAGDGIDLDDIITVFTDARICGATLCAIPAFQEAFVSLGEAPDGFGPEEEPQQPETDVAAKLIPEMTFAADDEFAISEKPWDGSSSRFTDEQWCRSTVLALEDGCTAKSMHKLPIREPSGALNRAAVHNAAARFNQTQGPAPAKAKAKSALRGAYRQLGEEIPDVLASDEDVQEFVKTEDGPGWLTHPVDTERLRRYWVRGPGAAKIGWGVPGDFNRCRTLLAKYVKPQHLNGYCANRHYDALGFWPGRPVSADTVPFNGTSISLVASATPDRPPAHWFTDPHLSGPSPIVVTQDRHVFGHLAQWGVCHIGLPGVCTTAPESKTDYAYFRTGAVLTDDGVMTPVGNITMDTGHAEQRCGARAAVGHYDNTGYCVASVAAGEDEYGIWVSGWVPPEVPEEKVTALRSVVLSGDWREIGGNLELVAALAVPVGGFPIPRTQLAASGGRQTSLVAAGLVIRHEPNDAPDVATIVSRAISEFYASQQRREKMAAMALRTRKARMAALSGRR